MRQVTRWASVTALVIVLTASGFAAGWYARPTGTTPDSRTLSFVAAGSLAPILPSFAAAFANGTPGVSVPTSAQLYEGSVAAANAVLAPRQPYDVFVSADYRVIPQHLEPRAATWEAVFASDPVVLAYDPSVPALGGINATNWPTKLLVTGVTLGAPNASADPLGANAIFVLELEDRLDGSAPGSLYAHFFEGAPGQVATPSASTKIVPETQVAAVLSTHEVAAYLIYRSYAVVNHLAYVALAPSVDLGSTDPASVALYRNVSTTVLGASGVQSVPGAPVLFAVTVPSTAPDAVLGDLFASYLLSASALPVWAADGFAPISPAWADHPNALPPALSGTGSALPALPGYL
jgi:molybdate/tungstate transport system substrate-binding protein